MARLVSRENIELQSKKIREVADALIAAGYVALGEQASALGLSRSTTWTILNTKHKKSGLSASVVRKILAQPNLPERVRRKILEYVEQKSSGAFGHNPQGASRFASGLAGCALEVEYRIPIKQTFDRASR